MFILYFCTSYIVVYFALILYHGCLAIAIIHVHDCKLLLNTQHTSICMYSL